MSEKQDESSPRTQKHFLKHYIKPATVDDAQLRRQMKMKKILVLFICMVAGVKGGDVFDLYNDIGFFQGETAPTIKYGDIKSMEFPSKNTILLTFREGDSVPDNSGQKNTPNTGGGIPDKGQERDEGFLLKALEDLGEKKRSTGKQQLKNWSYGFTGIFDKGYFFIDGSHVRAIEFGTTSQ